MKKGVFCKWYKIHPFLDWASLVILNFMIRYNQRRMINNTDECIKVINETIFDIQLGDKDIEL